MTTKRITTGWRGFSIAKEASFGSPATVDTAFNFEGPPVDIEINRAQTDENEITGLNEPGSHEVLNWKLDGVHRQRTTPHNLAYFLSAVMGKVTTDTPDAGNDPTVRRHWIERDVGNSALPSVTLIEFDGLGQKRFSGVFVKSVQVTGERNDFLKLTAQMGGMGKEEVDATPKPTVVAESYLRYGDVAFTRGGSLSGSVAGGDLTVTGSPQSFKADLQNFVWTIDNQAVPIYEMGDNSGYVSRAERGDRLLVAVAVVVSDDLRVGAVGIHPDGESADVHVPVVAGFSGMERGVVRELEWADRAGTVGPEDAERLPRPIREHSPGVAGVEYPLAIRTERHRVKRVVMVDPLEARQQHLALVHRRIEPQVAIDVGVDDEVGGLRDDHLVVDDRDAERSDQGRFLHERMGTISFAISVGVLQHDDAIAFRLPGMVGAVANTFGHPDAAVPVDVDVGRVVQ